MFGTILVGFGGIFGWFWAKDRVLIEIAARQLAADVARLPGYAVSANSYQKSCGDKLDENGTNVVGYQLRFENETNYVIEVVCVDESLAGPVLKQSRLAGPVKHRYGSGIMVPLASATVSPEAWVQLTHKQLTYAVGLIGSEVKIVREDVDEYLGGDTAAVATCSQWGFQCCRYQQEAGMGLHVFTNDCQKDCYQNCNQLPMVLFFNTDPSMNNQTRILSVKAPAEITFGYEISNVDDDFSQVKIDYGDGVVDDTVSNKEEALVHTYDCRRSTCTYLVKLSAQDEHGGLLVDSPLSQMKLVIEPSDGL